MIYPSSPALAAKWEVLKNAGYEYNFDRMVYFNRGTKKVFSVEFIEDHSEDELQRCVNEASNGAEWRFYFNSPPPASVQRQVESSLG